jgi:hypothetical protein
MARVNPPPHIKLPASITQQPELAQVLEDFNFNLFQLWVRTGKGRDFVLDNQTGLYEFDDLPSEKESRSILTTVTADYTTYSSETVLCLSPLTVYLNETPDDNELVKIKITNGNVTINAGSRTIDNEDFITVDFSQVQGLPMIDVFYSVEADAWYIV